MCDFRRQFGVYTEGYKDWYFFKKTLKNHKKHYFCTNFEKHKIRETL